MRAYILYKDKSVKGFRRLVNSGGAVFDKYRALAVSFLRYASGDMDKNLATYDQDLDINSVRLENIFPKTYKWLVSDVALKQSREYLDSIESRITEFEGGKEDNLKLMVGVQFLKLVLVSKLVETYLAAASSMKKAGLNVSDLKLIDLGIGKSVLKYFDVLQEFDSKSVDDWLNYKSDPATANYFFSSMKRILSILTSNNE